MPFLRRAAKPPAPLLELTVGLRGNRVVVGSAEPGVAVLGELRDYVGSVTGHAAPSADGRDPVAVLSAKMDLAEMVDDTCVVVKLAFEELCERDVVRVDDVPTEPDLPPVPQHSSTYDYIQAAHARAQLRLQWLEAAAALLAQHQVAVLPPLPPEEDEAVRAARRR